MGPLTRARAGLVALLASSLITTAPPSFAESLPNNSVDSKQIRNREVKKRDLARGAVTRKSIVPGAVDGTNILDHALHGVDIDRNTLGGEQIEESRLDFNVLQARLSGGCPTGEAVRSVSASGEPTCVDVLTGGFSDPLGGDLTGTLPNPTIAIGAITTSKLLDDSVTAAKVPLNALGGSDIAGLTGADIDANSLTGTNIDESSLGAVPTATNATQLGGQSASSFLTGASNAGGDLTGSTFSNPQLAGDVVGAAEVGSNALGGADINESDLAGASISNVNAATLGGVSSSGFVGTAATAGGDLGGTFSSLQIGAGSVGTSEVDSSLTASDIADTNTLTGSEIDESNLNVIRSTSPGQVVRGTLNATGSTGAGTDVVSDVPGFGTSDIESSACTPDAGVLAVAGLQLDNSSGTSVLVWELGPIAAVLGNTSVASAAQEALGSNVAGVLNADELLDIYLYRVDTGASARVTIGESTDGSNCRFVVEAVTSS